MDMQVVGVTFAGDACRNREISLRNAETIGSLRRRLAAIANVPPLQLKMAANGVLLSDSAKAAAHPGITVWSSPRYSSQRSSSSAAFSSQGRAWDVHTVVTAARRALAVAKRTLSSTAAAGSALRSMPLSLWAKLALWLAVCVPAWRGGLGGPFLIVSALAFVYAFGFSDRQAGEESAYTVFNGGRALPGQMGAEDIQRQMVGM